MQGQTGPVARNPGRLSRFPPPARDSAPATQNTNLETLGTNARPRRFSESAASNCVSKPVKVQARCCDGKATRVQDEYWSNYNTSCGWQCTSLARPSFPEQAAVLLLLCHPRGYSPYRRVPAAANTLERTRVSSSFLVVNAQCDMVSVRHANPSSQIEIDSKATAVANGFERPYCCECPQSLKSRLGLATCYCSPVSSCCPRSFGACLLPSHHSHFVAVSVPSMLNIVLRRTDFQFRPLAV